VNKKSSSFLSSFTTNIIFVVLTIIGIAVIPLLSIKLSPDKQKPSLRIYNSWANASPETMEKQVTSVYEAMYARMHGVKKISSSSGYAYSYIDLEFDKESNMDAVRMEVSSIARTVWPKLPKGVARARIQMNVSDAQTEKEFMVFTLNGPDVPLQLYKYAEKELQSRFSEITGMRKIELYGANPFRWEIIYDQPKLDVLGISPGEIEEAIRASFYNEEAGKQLVSKGEKGISIPVRFLGKMKELPDWNKIPVKKLEGRIVYLEDIASIQYQEQKPNRYLRLNGLNTISIVLYADRMVNSLKLAESVYTKLTDLKEVLPKGYSLHTSYDSSEFLRDELTKISWRSGLSVFILLVFVFVVSRQWRYLLIITLSLLCNLFIACIFYYVFHIEIQLYSLAGITISLGIIIDNIIVMADHLRHKNDKKVFLAILAATLTSIGALSIIFFLDEGVKENLMDFALVMIVNLGVSLCIALYLLPSLMDKIPLREEKYKSFMKRKRRVVRFSFLYERYICFGRKWRWIYIIVLILGFGLPVQFLPDKIEEETETAFAEIYNKSLGSDWFVSEFKPILEKALGGSFRLFTENVFDQNYYANIEKTKLYINCYMPDGATLEQMNGLMKEVEVYLAQFPEIEMYQTRIYSTDNSRITIHFTDEAEKSAFPYRLKATMENYAVNITGADFSIYGVGRGFSNRMGLGYKNSAIVLRGFNYDKLMSLAEGVEKDLLKHPRIKEVYVKSGNSWRNKPRTQYAFSLDMESLKYANFTLREAYRSLQTNAVNDNSFMQVLNEGYMEELALVSSANSDAQLWNIKNNALAKARKGYSRMKDLSSIQKEILDEEIYRENQEYKVVASYDLIGPPKLARKIQDKKSKELNKILPIGYKAKSGAYGGWWEEKDNKRIWLVLLVIVIVYFICAILLESLSQPLFIISMVPLSFVGVFLVFYLFDLNFDQGGFASFILLSGLVVNAALYIINDYNNRLRKLRVESLLQSYVRAFNTKFIPILLTIVSTGLGLIPFVLQGQSEVFWFALAVGVIGGLFFSFVGIVFFLPVFVKN